MKTKAEKLLGCFQVDYPQEGVLKVEELKGRYIPEKRLMYEKMYTKELVDEVFGLATDLEKAETKFFLLDRGKISNDERYEFLICIAYHIEDTCKGLETNNRVRQKYEDLSFNIPVKFMGYQREMLIFEELFVKTENVSTNQLMAVKNWLALERAKENHLTRLYLEYIFELVHISLKRIFDEVKYEIMG